MAKSSLGPKEHRNGASSAMLLLLVGVFRVQAVTIESCFSSPPQEFAGSIQDVVCPDACPYAAACPKGDAVQCIREQDCKHFDSRRIAFNGSATNEGTYCINCRIPRCIVCNATNFCEKCQNGYEVQEDGSCEYHDWTIWWLLIGALVGLCVWLVADFAWASFQPWTNKEAVDKGLAYRSQCHVRDSSKPGRPLYSVIEAKLHSDRTIAGAGVPLFFNWFILVACVAAWLALWSLVLVPSDWDDADASTTDVCIFLEVEEIDDQAWDNMSAENLSAGADIDFFTKADLPLPIQDSGVIAWTATSYIGVVIMSAIFLVLQHRLWCRLQEERDDQQPLLQHYAFEARGFPFDATHPGELKEYWTRVLQHLELWDEDAVVEVSVAYDYDDRKEEVEALIDDHLRKLESKAQNSMAVVAGNTPMVNLPGEGNAGGAEGETEDLRDPPPKAGTFWVQSIGALMLGTDMECCGKQVLEGYNGVTETPEDSAAKELLASLEGSGIVIVVLKKQDMVTGLLDKCKDGVPIRFRASDQEGYEIKIRMVPEEPDLITWVNFGLDKQPWKHPKRLSIGIVVMITTLVVWTAFYWPWSKFAIWSVGSSETAATIVDLFLGGFIALGNAVVSNVTVILVNFYGFRYVSDSNLAYLLIIVPCVMINIASDLFVTWSNAVMEVSEDLMTDFDFLWSYGQRLSMASLFLLLVPGYVWLPYAGEPCATVLLPYWVGIWRIKGDRRITKEHAERLLIAGEIDIINPPYCDIICCPTTFLITFLAPSSSHWKFFLALLFFAWWVYTVNRVRILRWQTAQRVATNQLHVAESYLWALPCGLLAATFGSHVAPEGDYWNSILGIVFFAVHVCCHMLFVRYVVPMTGELPGPSKQSYHQACKNTWGATFRNTNPIEVLKSQQKGSSANEEALIYFKIGKEHLQPKSSQEYDDATGQIFTPHQVIEEVRGAGQHFLQHAAQLVHQVGPHQARGQPVSTTIGNNSAADDAN